MSRTRLTAAVVMALLAFVLPRYRLGDRARALRNVVRLHTC